MSDAKDSKTLAPAAGSGGQSSPAPVEGAPAAIDYLQHKITVSAGSIPDVKSSIALRFATDLPATKSPKVYIKIAHKPNAASMDLYKIKGQLQMALGFAKLPEMSLDLDKNTKQFVISFVPPMLDAIPLPLPINDIARHVQALGAHVKALYLKFELSVGTASFLPIVEKKAKTAAPAAAANTTATAAGSAPGGPVEGSSAGAATRSGSYLVDTIGARVCLEASARKQLIESILDLVGFPVQESGFEVATFFGSTIESTAFNVQLQSFRQLLAQWMIPLPPSFWTAGDVPSMTPGVGAGSGSRSSRHTFCSVVAKLADPDYARAVRARRLAARAAVAAAAAASAAAALAAATAPAPAAGTNTTAAPAPIAAASAPAPAAAVALPKVKTYLEWRSVSDGKSYYVRIADAEAGDAADARTSRAGDVTETAPDTDDFIPFALVEKAVFQQLQAFPAALLKPITIAQQLLWTNPEQAKELIGSRFHAAVSKGLKMIPVEGKRVVAGLAQKGDETLLALDCVQLVLPGGCGLSLDFTGLVDFRVIPWDLVIKEMNAK